MQIGCIEKIRLWSYAIQKTLIKIMQTIISQNELQNLRAMNQIDMNMPYISIDEIREMEAQALRDFFGPDVSLDELNIPEEFEMDMPDISVEELRRLEKELTGEPHYYGITDEELKELENIYLMAEMDMPDISDEEIQEIEDFLNGNIPFDFFESLTGISEEAWQEIEDLSNIRSNDDDDIIDKL